MKRYPVSMAREQFASILDEADRSGAVVIERRDVQYVITARPAKSRTGKARAAIEVLDPAIEAGNWQWEWTPSGAQFQPGRKRS